MFGDATPDSHRFFFPRNWLDEEVKQQFSKYMDAMELPYSDLTDFINSGYVSTSLSGLKDDSNIKQEFDFGREKSFKGSKPVEEYISKDIDVTMKLKESNINWFILRMQLVAYLNWKRPTSKNFMPPVYLQMLDEEDRILFEINT